MASAYRRLSDRFVLHNQECVCVMQRLFLCLRQNLHNIRDMATAMQVRESNHR